MPDMHARGVEDGGTFIATLTTKGRVTGNDHTRTLKAVIYGGRVYFSRHRPDSDWFKNAVACPSVRIGMDGKEFDGVAEEVTDEVLAARISGLKYPGQQRAHERRVVIQVTLSGA